MLSVPESTLIRAVKRSDKRLLEVILPKCIQFGKRDENGKTALMIAAEMNHRYFCQLLLEKEYQYLTDDGQNALILAVKANSTYVIPVLAQRCTYIQDKSGKCALCYAVQQCSLPLCELLIRYCDLGPEDYRRAIEFLPLITGDNTAAPQIEALLKSKLRPHLTPPTVINSPALTKVQTEALESSEDSSRNSHSNEPPLNVQIIKSSHVLPRFPSNTNTNTLEFSAKINPRASSIGAYSGTRASSDSAKSFDLILNTIKLENLQAENTRLKNAIAALNTEKDERLSQMQKTLDEYAQKLQEYEVNATIPLSASQVHTDTAAQDNLNLEKIAEYMQLVEKKDKEIAILHRAVIDNSLIKDFDKKLLDMAAKLEEATKSDVTMSINSGNRSCASTPTCELKRLSLSMNMNHIDESLKISDSGDKTLLEDSHISQSLSSRALQAVQILPLLNEYREQARNHTSLLNYYRQLNKQYILAIQKASTASTQDFLSSLQTLLSLRTAGMERAIILVQEKDEALRKLSAEYADLTRQNIELQTLLTKRRRNIIQVDLKDLFQKYNVNMEDLETTRFRALTEELYGQNKLLSNSLRIEQRKFEAFEEAYNKQLEAYFEAKQTIATLEDEVHLLKQHNDDTQIKDENVGSPFRSTPHTMHYSRPTTSILSNSSSTTSITEECENCIELNRDLSQVKAELKRVKNMHEVLLKKNKQLLQDFEDVVRELDSTINIRRVYALVKPSASTSVADTPQLIDDIKCKIKRLTQNNPPLSIRMEQPVTSRLLRESVDGHTNAHERMVEDMWTQTFNLAMPIEETNVYNAPAVSPMYTILPGAIATPHSPTNIEQEQSLSTQQNTTILHMNINNIDQSLQNIDADLRSQQEMENPTALFSPLQLTILQTAQQDDFIKDLDGDLEKKLDEHLGLTVKDQVMPNGLHRHKGSPKRESVAPPPPSSSNHPSGGLWIRRNVYHKEPKDPKHVKGKEHKDSINTKRRTVPVQLTPLMLAVKERDISKVQTNLQYIKTAALNGMTALMFAVEEDFIEAVQVLAPLEAGICASNEETALLLALRLGHLDAARILAQFEGVKLQRINLANDRFTELMKAAKYNNIGMVWALMEYQKRMQDENKRTALMYAADAGNFEVCRILAGMEAGMTTNTGDTALMMAVINQNVKIVELLLPLEFGNHGNKLTNVGKGYTALQLAVYYGYYNLVQLLYHKECTLSDNNGRTCLDYANNCSSRVNAESKKAILAYIQNGGLLG